jgi:hypothetical protein
MLGIYFTSEPVFLRLVALLFMQFHRRTSDAFAGHPGT